MCHNDRTGQPVEVERTAFIAFIEKEQVRKAPCISHFLVFQLVCEYFSLFPSLLRLLQAGEEKEWWRVFLSKVRTLCVTIQEVDGLRTSNGIQYRLQLLYSNGEQANIFQNCATLFV